MPLVFPKTDWQWWNPKPLTRVWLGLTQNPSRRYKDKQDSSHYWCPQAGMYFPSHYRTVPDSLLGVLFLYHNWLMADLREQSTLVQYRHKILWINILKTSRDYAVHVQDNSRLDGRQCNMKNWSNNKEILCRPFAQSHSTKSSSAPQQERKTIDMQKRQRGESIMKP